MLEQALLSMEHMDFTKDSLGDLNLKRYSDVQHRHWESCGMFDQGFLNPWFDQL